MTAPAPVTYRCPECQRTTRQVPGLLIACVGARPDGGAGNRHRLTAMREVARG